MVADVDGGGDASAAADMLGLYAQLHGLLDRIAAASPHVLSDTDLVTVTEEHERATRRMESVSQPALIEVENRGVYRKLGFQNISGFLSRRLRITDTFRRKRRLQALGQFTTPSGTRLSPSAPTLADGVADGVLGPDHVHAVLDVLGKIPVALPAEVHTAAEQTLGQLAREHTPAELGVLGQQLLARVDPDGELTEPADRARQRQLWLGRQDAQQMSVIKGRLDPATRAMFDVVLASWAAKGVNNPDDEHSPHGSVHDADPDVVEAAAQRDTRTTAQRQHDAFRALLHAALDGGLLGKSHRGLPPQLIVSITSQELREQAGLGRTATGTTLPIGAVVEVAARAQQYLAVYADHSSEILYFGQARRFASRGQRLALADSYGGCSHPDCSAPMVHVEIHHAARDYARGGNTDIHDLAPACGVHNRMVGPDTGQYTTELIRSGPDAGRFGWRLNTEPGQPQNPLRVNRFFRIDREFRTAVEHIRDAAGIPADPPSPPVSRCEARLDAGVQRVVHREANSQHGHRRTGPHDHPPPSLGPPGLGPPDRHRPQAPRGDINHFLVHPDAA